MPELIWESVRETKFFKFEYFSFVFCFVEMFQSSLNLNIFLQSSFQQNSRLNFLSDVYLVEFELSTFFNFTLFLRKLHSRSKWRNPSASLSFFVSLQFGPRIRTEGQNSSSWQKEEGSFLVPYCQGLFLPFPLRPNQVPHVVSLIFFLRNKFLYFVFIRTLIPASFVLVEALLKLHF